MDGSIDIISSQNLDSLNVLRRRFDEYDLQKKGFISLEDMNELSRFFHRPMMSAQQIDSLVDDTVLFHEAVVFLVEPSSPLLKVRSRCRYEDTYSRLFS